MTDYKWLNREHTQVLRYPNACIVEGGTGWDGFQVYLADGGIVDPWKTRDELEQDALNKLWAHHDSLIDAETINKMKSKNPNRHNGKLHAAIHRKAIGQNSPSDDNLIAANDILDSWFDAMERIAEDEGETWIEEPTRTDQELINFDPAVLNWPEIGA